MIDIVTIVHNDKNKQFAKKLEQTLELHEKDNYRLIVRDNSKDNVGFARGCNIGAKEATTNILGFLNPDVVVDGKFINKVEAQFREEALAITGCTFRNRSERYNHIGLRQWVCGAALFVRREWFESVGGFHEGYIWSWEETDLCRQAQDQRKVVRAIELPLTHDRRHVQGDSEEDKKYKHDGLKAGKKLYYERWG